VLTPVQSGMSLFTLFRCVLGWWVLTWWCLAVLSQAMQEEFRGFSYTADFE
jgi:hypothetical protein